MIARIAAFRLWAPVLALSLCWAAGCAGPGPNIFPASPTSVQRLPNGRIERLYDIDRDGRPDFREQLSTEGRVVLLRYDLDGDQQIDLEVDLPRPPGGEIRHLVILVDSVPYESVRSMRDQGRFRLFPPPSRVISPFPVMTDLCLADFFGISPSVSIEAEYYDGQCLSGGMGRYVQGTNSRWLEFVDYHLRFIAHSLAYLRSDAWYGHELRRIQDAFNRRGQGNFIGYCVGTSALGAQLGPAGHQLGLVRLDRFCQQIMYRTRGQVQITLLSDHGHNHDGGERISIRRALTRLGYRVGKTLVEPGDVVVPAFGMVTYAAIHTECPADVAGDLVAVQGIDLTCYLDASNQVVVLSADGKARISRSAAGYRYLAEFGDPLKLDPVLESLGERGKVDADGYVDDRVLFDATIDHVYPDVLHRLWRAFGGLTENTPDVLVSIKDGWYAGNGLMSSLLDLAAAHGSLDRLSSTAFAMTTAGELPPTLRMEDLAEALRGLGVAIPGGSRPQEMAASSGVPAVGALAPVVGDGVVEQVEEPLPVD